MCSKEGGRRISHVEDSSPGTDLIRDTRLRSAGGVHNTSSLNAGLGYSDNEETHSEYVGSDESPSKENVLDGSKRSIGPSHGRFPGLISKIYMYVVLWAIFMVLIGPTCIHASQGKGPPNFIYKPYRQRGVARNTSELITTIPGPGYVMNITWMPMTGLFDCSMVVQSNNCTISTVNGKKNTCTDTLPFITVESNDTGHQRVMATVKEDAWYCVSVSAINHHHIYQGGFLVVPRPEDPSGSGVNWMAGFFVLLAICFILVVALLYVCRKRRNASQFQGNSFS
nr:uncharacterized protein LOC129279995 [Lytechinus pictus]